MKHQPNPRHRYHRKCQCVPCRKVRYVLMGLEPRVQMSENALQILLNACHDYGTVHEGGFPTLECTAPSTSGVSASSKGSVQ